MNITAFVGANGVASFARPDMGLISFIRKGRRAMSVTRLGRHFIKLLDEDGKRMIVRINAIQQASDYDECQREAYLTVAGRTIAIRASLDEVEEILEEASSAHSR